MNSRPIDIVGHFAVYLNTAVHRPRVHDQSVRFGRPQLVVIKAVEIKIFAHRGHETAGHAFGLQAQHHDDVTVDQALGQIVMNINAEPVDMGRQQGRRRHHPHPRAHGVEQMDIGAGHPAMADIAANGHVQPLDPALAAADGERVEQSLSGMLMAAVAGVDDRAIDLFGEQLDGPGIAMAHDQHIGMHGVQGHRRVDQGFAFFDRTGRHRHIDHIAAETLAGQLKRGARAGRVLEKQIDQGAPAQQPVFFIGLAVLIDIAVG